MTSGRTAAAWALRSAACGAQDFAPRRTTLNGAECRLLHRQARPVPTAVSAAPAAAPAPVAAQAPAASETEARPAPVAAPAPAPAAGQPVFTYAPFVNASGAPVPASAVSALVTPQLPGGRRAATEADQPVSISGAALVGVDGQPLTLRGINWCAPDLAIGLFKGHGVLLAPDRQRLPGSARLPVPAMRGLLCTHARAARQGLGRPGRKHQRIQGAHARGSAVR